MKSESNPGGIRNLAISEKRRWVFKQIKSCYITELLIPHSSPQTWVYRSGESTHYRRYVRASIILAITKTETKKNRESESRRPPPIDSAICGLGDRIAGCTPVISVRD